jgi:hypothetical protein
VRATSQWAADLDISQWQGGVARLANYDAIVVGSGGSAVATQLLAQLHIARAGRLAVAMTPLEFVAEERLPDAAVWFVSAGGANTDILRAWTHAQRLGVRHIGLLCASPNSPLANDAITRGIEAPVIFNVPSGRDGFLATNSLVAFCCLILRFYHVTPPIDQFDRAIRPSSILLLERSTLVVLYGGWLKSIAIDIESRFTEAALGSVQFSDFRNFAHGRHHWLAKRGQDTAILALVTPRIAALARDTLAAVPSNVTVDTWLFESDGPAEVLVGLTYSMLFAQAAAVRLGYDAGRPGVPEFGHRIYELRTGPDEPSHASPQSVAIGRKLAFRKAYDVPDYDRFAAGLDGFEKNLLTASFAGVVLDYDGTLVSTAKRFDPIEPGVAAELNRLLDEGGMIGVATGRGKSVHTALRAAVDPIHRERVVIGYYNGAVIRPLADSCDDLADAAMSSLMQSAESALGASFDLQGATIESRPYQITVSWPTLDEVGLWLTVKGVLEREGLHSLLVVRSSHSVDVLSSAVSKLNVIMELGKRLNLSESSFLKVGDRGRWPGNDWELLGGTHGLSVDEVSFSPAACWNLAPQTHAGPQATLYYLTRLADGRYR